MLNSLKKIVPILLTTGLLSTIASGYALTPLATTSNGGYTGQAKSSQNNNNKMQWKARHEAEENAILDQLGLTPEQRKKIDAIKAESHTQGKAAHEQMHQQHKDFEAYLFSAGATEQGANVKIDSSSQRMANMGKLRVKTLFKMRALMSPEQFQKFGILQHERWENKMKRHHHQPLGE